MAGSIITVTVTDPESENTLLSDSTAFGSGQEFEGTRWISEGRAVAAKSDDVIALKDIAGGKTTVRAIYVRNAGAAPLGLYGIPSGGYSEHTPTVTGGTPLGVGGQILLAAPDTGYQIASGKFERVTVANLSDVAGSYDILVVFA